MQIKFGRLLQYDFMLRGVQLDRGVHHPDCSIPRVVGHSVGVSFPALIWPPRHEEVKKTFVEKFVHNDDRSRLLLLIDDVLMDRLATEN